MKQGTAKVLCSCQHEQQDKMHGKQVRVANSTAKQDGTAVEVRCTVCNKSHRVNATQVR